MLDAIRAGHCYITRTPGDGPAELTVNGTMMGGTAAPAQQYTLQFDVQGLVCGDEILLVNENGLFRKWQASVSRERRTLEVPEALFYRLEVRRTFPRGSQPVLLTNPVYLK